MSITPHQRWALLAFVNYVAFVLAAVMIGGDAINGMKYTADGAFYLALHGAPTEVHPGVWLYSIAHMASVVGMVVMALVTMRWSRAR
jgi:hypothetical protein